MVCTILAVEEWVEEVIVENAAVEGIEVVVIRTVVVLGVVVLSKQHLKGLERNYVNDLRNSPVIVGVAQAGPVRSQRSVAGMCVVRNGVRCGKGDCSVKTSGDSSGLYKPRRRSVGGRKNCRRRCC